MGVYRSDQAQLTFAAEAAQGGDPEMIEANVAGVTARLSAAANAGDRSISIDTVASGTLAIGDSIMIGFDLGGGSAAGAAVIDEHEVRKIEAMSDAGNNATNTLLLDRPLAFYHPDTANVKETSSSPYAAADAATLIRQDKNKFITFIPGIYDTIDVPDPEMTIEGRRFLSTTSKRNFTIAYPGTQSLVGSVSGITLLNGWPLRFPIGSVVTTPSSGLASTSDTLSSAAKKGDVFIHSSNGSMTAGNYINIDDGSSTKSEVRRIISEPDNGYYKLDHPLQFAHDSGASTEEITSSVGYYSHEIIEQNDLDTVSWHIHMKDSTETSPNSSLVGGYDFDRRYVGGMIGSCSISAEEGGMVSMSWDSVNFLNMVHNQRSQATVGTNLYSGANVVHNMPRWGLMQPIDEADVNRGASSHTALNTASYPTTQPYYFSEGVIKFFGQEFARIRSFSLSISNSEEPRYYIGRQGARARGPYEIREGAREYSMSASVALPDASVVSSAEHDDSGQSQSGALELFKQLLLEGDYGGTSAATARAGFTASLKFERGTNDFILIDIPTSSSDSAGPTAGSNAINSQGIFINAAPHSITGDNPFQVDVDMLFRSIKIRIRDSVPVYP